MGVVLDALYAFWNQILYAIQNFRIFDLLDIIIIAWLIYKAIGFLRETRAGQLVKGIAILLFVYAFADLFELSVLQWVLSTVVDSAIIAVAIIFQPELRRILERVGQTKISYNQSMDEETEKVYNCIDSVCKAARTMQENKIGALIVFERNTQLGEIINTGTVIDAETSVSMVNNVFFPKSPLHDGAMVIRNGRIHAAGCILPLTQSQAFSSALGTRHRAAIGMTENSDAVVLVVSEETGNISIVCNGEIIRNYNSVTAAADLRTKLIDSELERKDNKVISVFKKLFPFLDKNKKKDEVKQENE